MTTTKMAVMSLPLLDHHQACFPAVNWFREKFDPSNKNLLVSSAKVLKRALADDEENWVTWWLSQTTSQKHAVLAVPVFIELGELFIKRFIPAKHEKRAAFIGFLDELKRPLRPTSKFQSDLEDVKDGNRGYAKTLADYLTVLRSFVRLSKIKKMTLQDSSELRWSYEELLDYLTGDVYTYTPGVVAETKSALSKKNTYGKVIDAVCSIPGTSNKH